MTVNDLQKLMADPGLLTKDTLAELRTLLVRYPYFQTVRLLYMKNLALLDDPSLEEELSKAALYVSDRRVLFDVLQGDRYRIKPEVKAVPKPAEGDSAADRTLSLIDAFLESQADEGELLPSGSSDVSTDYVSYMLQEDAIATEKPEATASAAMPKLKGQELIDSFLSKAENEDGMHVEALVPDAGEKPEPVLAAEDDDEPDELAEMVSIEEDESCFTETLAKIYVKQQRYSKALEIIKKLSLKYQKKNAYFADQIRFLEKLIINTKSK